VLPARFALSERSPSNPSGAAFAAGPATDAETADRMHRSKLHRGSTAHQAHRRPGARLTRAAGAMLVLGSVFLVTAAGPANGQAAYLGDQWGLTQVNAPAAWASGTGAGVTIGIVDTGVDANHRDLSGKVLASANCIGANGNPNACGPGGGDDNGHGTHVAGIAAARGIGVSGVAPNATFAVAKVLDSSGSGNLQDVAAGILWVVAHGARVVNLSIGSDPGFGGVNCLVGGCDASILEAAANEAWNAGAIPVIAAGNNGNSLDLIAPAGYGSTNAVIVAATGPTGQVASYSSTPGNAKWGVLAPGGDDPGGPTTPACGTADQTEILSTFWTADNQTNCYVTDEGTSMATPFVTGTLALLLGRGLSRDQAVQVLLGTLNHSVTCSGCQGLIDAGAAMAAANRILPPPPSPTPAPVAPGRTSTRSSAPATSTGHGATGATVGASAPAPTTTTTSSSSTTAPPAPKVTASALHHHGRGGSGLWVALILVVAVAGVAVATEMARRRAEAARRRAVTVPARTDPLEDAPAP
jgi:subtilisin family serine protease